MPSDSTAPRSLPTGRLVVFSTLVSLCAALLAVYVFVLRPATKDKPIEAGTFLTDKSEHLNQTAEKGKPAPVHELEAFDGSTVSTDSFAGKPVVINFWATYCVPCITEMPMLEELHQDYGDEVTFIGINVGESVEVATPQVDATGVSYLQLLDPDMEALGDYGAIALPHTVVLDADGTIVAEKNDALKDTDELREMIEAAR